MRLTVKPKTAFKRAYSDGREMKNDTKMKNKPYEHIARSIL